MRISRRPDNVQQRRGWVIGDGTEVKCGLGCGNGCGSERQGRADLGAVGGRGPSPSPHRRLARGEIGHTRTWSWRPMSVVLVDNYVNTLSGAAALILFAYSTRAARGRMAIQPPRRRDSTYYIRSPRPSKALAALCFLALTPSASPPCIHRRLGTWSCNTPLEASFGILAARPARIILIRMFAPTDCSLPSAPAAHSAQTNTVHRYTDKHAPT